MDLTKCYPWICTKLLENILKNILQNTTKNQNMVNIQLKNYKIVPGSEKDQNYVCQMIRVILNYTIINANEKDNNNNNMNICNETSVIIKLLPSRNSSMEMLINEYGLYVKETTVYKEILPRISMLLNSINDTTVIGPKCYMTDMIKSYICLEDLTLYGYKLQKRHIGLDFDHYKLVMEKIAKWHAGTAVLGIQDPEIMHNHLKPNISNNRFIFEPLQTNVIETMAEITKSWSGYERISAKFDKLKYVIEKKCCDAYLRDDNGFNVLTHGDLWANNILFQYDTINGNPIDCLLIDFQLGFWGSPATDLSYILYTSSHDNVKEMEWDRLIEYYYRQLKMNLIKLNYKNTIPTLQEMHRDILKRGIHSVVIGFLTAVNRIEVTPLNDIDHTTASGDGGGGGGSIYGSTEADKLFRIQLFSNPNCRNNLKYLLDYFDRKGYFD